MFKLSQLFAALRRLTNSVNSTADLFDEANAKLSARLSFDEEETTPALPAPESNGHSKARLAKSKS